MSQHNRMIGDLPKIGIRPIIDGRRKGVRESLEEQTMGLARAVAEPTVALSGGCFQNRLLTERAREGLTEAGFRVLVHRRVPPNDGGISLGQVAVAAARRAPEGSSAQRSE